VTNQETHLSMCVVNKERNINEIANDLEQPIIQECISAQYYDEFTASTLNKAKVSSSFFFIETLMYKKSIIVHGLKKKFGSKNILDDISFSIYEQEIFW